MPATIKRICQPFSQITHLSLPTPLFKKHPLQPFSRNLFSSLQRSFSTESNSKTPLSIKKLYIHRPPKIELVILGHSGITSDCGGAAAHLLSLNILAGKNEKALKEYASEEIAFTAKYTSLIPGTTEAIDKIRQQFKVKIGSTTNFTREIDNIFLQNAARQGYRPDISTNLSEVPQPAPYPFMILKNMKHANIEDPRKVLRVGSRKEEMQEGKAVVLHKGIPTWTVGLCSTGNYVGKEWVELMATPFDQQIIETEFAARILQKAGADYLCNALASLPRIIEIINRRLANNETPEVTPLYFLQDNT